jgi:hypothetical protein
MQINLSWDSSVSAAPAGFQAEVQQAATELGAAILNPVSVSVQVGWNEIGGTPMAPASGGKGGPSSSVLPVDVSGQATSNNLQVISLLNKAATINDAQNLTVPASNPFGNDFIELSSAQAKVLGVPNTNVTAFDGMIGLAMPSYTTPQDMVEAALHELAHALGRVNGFTSNGAAWYTFLDLFTYSAPGVLWNPTSSTPGYFSIDKGVTNLGSFSAIDVGDFVSSITDPFSAGGYGISTLTPLDNTVLQTLGFDVAQNQFAFNTTNTRTPVVPNSTYVGTPGDTVIYTGSLGQYTITPTPGQTGSVTIQDTVAGRDAGSVLTNVDFAQFKDGTLAFNLGGTAPAGQAAELIGAAYGHSALTDKALVGNWIAFFQNGGTVAQAAADLVGSGTVNASDNTSFVTKVWQNVVGTPIDSADLTTFTTDLTNGTFTQSRLLAAAAQTTINQTTQGLSALAQTGLDFTTATQTGTVQTLAYANPAADYSITNNTTNGTVSVSGMGVNDTLTNIQRVQFSDQTIAFDLGANQSAGEAVLLLGAAQGSPGITNKTALGSAIATLDGGGSLTQAAQNLLTSGAVSYASNTDMVTKVWQNVVGTPIDAADLALFTGDLANGTFTQASLLALAAETSQNLAHVGLVGLAAHGVAFA